MGPSGCPIYNFLSRAGRRASRTSVVEDHLSRIIRDGALWSVMAKEQVLGAKRNAKNKNARGGVHLHVVNTTE